MRKSILLFVLFTLTSIPLLLFAQGGYQVTGHIISAEDNQPMIGVSVLEKGTTNGVITDINGNYSITVTKSPATLQFSYVGMKTIDKQVTASTRINLTMENDAQMVEEVVVVAYGVRKKGTIRRFCIYGKSMKRWKMFLLRVSTRHCKDRRQD